MAIINQIPPPPNVEPIVFGTDKDGNPLILNTKASWQDWFMRLRQAIQGQITLPPLGTANQFLSVNAGATDVEYKTLTGTANQVSVTFGVGSATFALAGPHAFTTQTAHGVLLGEGTSAITATTALTDGQLLVGQTGADPLPKTLSGDASLFASGALTFTTVNSNVGTFGDATHVAVFTVNGKGLVTAASSSAITFPVTSVFSQTGAIANLSGDITTNNSSVTTLATVNSNVGTFGSATQVAQVTVNGKGLVTAVANVTISGVAPSGTAGGDLSGTYPNPTVAKINGVTLGSTTATSGNLLIGSGSAWASNAMSGDATLSSTGVITLGNIVSASTNLKITYNAKGLVTSGTTAAAADLSNGTTGSGAIVLATSPTLTTAALGSSTATTQIPADNSTKIATTAYVDAAILGQDFKEACKYGTTTALPSVVYANGSSGVGATLTAAAFGAVSFDSSTPSVGDRVLVKNQVSTFQNGIYTVTVVGAVATLFVLTRATDFNQSYEIKTGDSVFITSGSTLSATTWAVNSSDNPVMGTDAITFAQAAGQGSFTAGNGIAITGNSIAIDTSVTVDKTTSQTLTNKTFTSPTINGLSSTRTILTSGSGTYTTPANCKMLNISIIGGGGGGGGTGTASATSGGTGGNTTFSSLTGSGGVGGGAGTTGAGSNGGSGGAASGGDLNFVGGGGGIGNQASTSNAGGGFGAFTPYGGSGNAGPAGNAGSAGSANTGGGGGGAGGNGTTTFGAGGGGAGGFVNKIISSPAATYSYAIGSGGSAGGAGTSGFAGGAGGSGLIVVEEFYI